MDCNNFFLSVFTEYYLFYLRANSYLNFHLWMYLLFSFVIIFFSFFLIFISNPIYSVISLIIIYFFVAFVLLCFETYFLSVIFILIYLGAVVVLFLFIVMMLNIKIQNTLKIFNIIPLFFLISLFFFFFQNIFLFKEKNFTNYLEMDESLLYNFLDFFSIFKMLSLYIDNIYLLNIGFLKENYILFGFLLYSYFYVEIIIASYILLLAMVGCITLTLIKDIENKKKQEPMEQLLQSNVFLKKVSFVIE
jgi:NADH:ubiquinone oxidoreductase subunit 6 (subunit J)